MSALMDEPRRESRPRARNGSGFHRRSRSRKRIGSEGGEDVASNDAHRWALQWILQDDLDSAEGDCGMGDFLDRLRERKCVQWMLAYLALGWLALQLGDVLSEIWSWSPTVLKAVSLVIGLGVLPAGVVSWFHGEQGRQEVCVREAVLLAGLLAAAAVVLFGAFGS